MNSYNLPLSFIFKRIHSLVGIISLGLYLLVYSFISVQALGPDGYQAYNQSISFFLNIPFFILLEVIVIYLPLVFYLIYGLYLFSQRKPNLSHYPYGSHIRYWLNHLAFIIGILFLFYHFYCTRISAYLIKAPLDYLWMVRLFESTLRVWLYVFGTGAVYYHFTFNLWSFLVDWGVTVNKTSQRISLYFLFSVFVLLTFVHVLVLGNFIYHYESAPGWVAGILNFVKGALFR